MTAYLEGIKGEYAGQRVHLGFSQILLGRGSASQVRFHASNVSREHATIYYTNGVYAVQDCSSRLGTFVNGKAVTRAQLHSGDVITIGVTSFRFVQSAQTQPHPASTKQAAAPAPHPVNVGLIVLIGVLLVVGVWGLSMLFNRSQESTVTISEPEIQVEEEALSEPTETLDSVAVVSAGNLFADNFDTGIDNEWEALHGEWRMINGNLQAVSGYPAVISIGDQTWTDYTIEAKIGGLRNTVSGALQYLETDPNILFFGVRNTGDAAYYFGVSYYLQRCTYEVGDEVITTFYSEENYIGDDASHVVRIDVNGNMYSFTVDGEVICTFSDSTLQSGEVTISSYPGTGEEPSYPWMEEIVISQR